MNVTKPIVIRGTLATMILVALAVFPVFAQSSASYRLEEHVVNAGGHPLNGTVMASASYRVTLDSIGDALAGPEMNSASYGMGVGFGSAYPPPGETHGLLFSDHDTLIWDAERSAGTYNLYRALMSDLFGAGYGECFAPGLPATTGTDTGTPPASDGWFYLVTAENRLGEEGTKGWDSSATEREGNVCP
jgi:hypothetical protein